jgi:membrane protein
MPQGLWPSIKETINDWLYHEGPRLAASLSLYSLLSLAPLVILTIAIASLAFGRPAAQQALLAEVRDLMGIDGVRAVQTIIQNGQWPRTNSVASILGVLVLLVGASSVFGELQSALNKIWDVQSSGHGGVAALIKSRIFSFAMVLALGFLLLVSLLLSTALSSLGGFFEARLDVPRWLLILTNDLVAFAVISVLIGLILRYVPDRRTRWRDIWQGAIATALLFTIGKALLGLYLGKAAVGSAYGAASSLIVVIVWVYYSAMIFYFGAEFTKVRSQPASS